MKFGIIVNRENYYIKVCSGGGYVKTRRHFYRGSLKNRRLMTKGGGGVKNPEKLMTSFMNGPISDV